MQPLLAKLGEVEAEMKAIGYWSSTELPELEQNTFEHWLQFKFLPTARQRIEHYDFPGDTNVGVMAMRQYDYHAYVPEAQHLYLLLTEFDKLVREEAGEKGRAARPNPSI